MALVKSTYLALILIALAPPAASTAQPPAGSTFRRLTALPPITTVRRSGPFCGPDLNSIKLQIDGQGAHWYFTDFLTSNPAGPFVSRYLPASYTPQQLPPDISSTGTARHVPGAFKTQDGMQDIRFYLSCVRYSRRFGGTVQLLFRDEETYEYDARHGSTLWDLDDVDLSIFVVPTPAQFNTAVAVGTERKFVEIRPRTLLAYTVGTNGSITPDASNQAAAFDTLWSSVASGILAGGAPASVHYPVGAFVYGFIHYLWSATLTGANRVAMMELDENTLNLTLRAGQPTVDVSVRVTNISLSEGFGQTGTSVTVSGTASWDPTLTTSHRFNLDDRTSTSSVTLVSFPLSACPASGSPSVIVTGQVRQTYIWGGQDSPLGSSNHGIDCAALQQAANSSAWGVRAYSVMPFSQTDSGGTQLGHFEIIVSTAIQNR